MTVRQNVPAGAPCWVDLMSSDVEGVGAFYAELFGWEIGPGSDEFGGYRMALLDGEPVAGLMPTMDPNSPTNWWSVYLGVADAADTVEKAKANGGSVVVEAMPIADLGSMAVVLDNAGAPIGMWQPAAHRGGVVGTAGAPCHFELHTRGYDGAIAFYRDVFGWNAAPAADEPGFRYTVYDVAPGENAGIYDAANSLPEGMSSYWTAYFAAADLDHTLKEVERLGGRIVEPAVDTPYGRLASAADPAGAVFKLRSE